MARKASGAGKVPGNHLHQYAVADTPEDVDPYPRILRDDAPRDPDAPDPDLTHALDVERAWETLRTGSPLDDLEGWGLGIEQPRLPDPNNPDRLTPDELAAEFRRRHPDLRDLYHELRAMPFQNEWRMSTISPRKATPTAAALAYPELPRHLAEQRFNGDIKRERLVTLLGQGCSIAETCRRIGISDGTYRQWRKRYPDFRAQADRAISHRRLRAIAEGHNPGIYGDDFELGSKLIPFDDTFTSRRMYFFGYDTYDHHAKIIDALESAPPLSVTLILLPPGAGKTTVLSDYIKDQIAQDPNVRVLWVSEKADQDSPVGKSYLDIKEYLTDPTYDNPDAQFPVRAAEFQRIYGPFRDEDADKGKPWNQNFMKVHKASGRRDYTVQIAGWRSKVYGARADILLIDDVQSAESINQTDQILDRLTKTFFNRTLNPSNPGRVFIIGTMVGVGDVYSRMIELGIPDKVLLIPALDADGNSYCPEMYPNDVLAKVRQRYGEEAWWTAFMMAPQQAETATFLPEDIARAWRDDITARVVPDETWRVVTACDPALEGGNAVVTCIYNGDHLIPIDANVRYKLGRNEAVIDHVSQHFRYSPTDVIIERNTGEGIGRDSRFERMASDYGFSIHLHHTDARKNNDKVIWGVGGMAAGFIRGELLLPRAGDGESVFRGLVSQLEQWRPNSNPKLVRQDLVMALWFCWVFWLRQREYAGLSEIGAEWRTDAMPWQPGDMSGSWGRPDLPRGRQLAGVGVGSGFG